MAHDGTLGKRQQEQIDGWIAALPKEREMLVYCVHGYQVSNNALDRLLAAGFKARY